MTDSTPAIAAALPIPLRDELLDRLCWLTDHDLALVVATVEDAIDEGHWGVRYVGPG